MQQSTPSDEAEQVLLESSLTEIRATPQRRCRLAHHLCRRIRRSGKGFDVAIANPPYVQLEKSGGRLRRLYQDVGFATIAGRGDLYQLFYERGCQLLREDGLLAYITSNSWLRSDYGKSLRRYFSELHTPLRLLELGKDVFESAIVDSGVLFLRKGAGGGRIPSRRPRQAPAGHVPAPGRPVGRGATGWRSAVEHPLGAPSTVPWTRCGGKERRYIGSGTSA